MNKTRVIALRMAERLVLPAETPARRLAFIGTTGSGKTYAAMKLAELMWEAGLPFVAIDVMGIWYGLRIDADGQGDGLPILIFGGRRGDVPITEHDGALVAETVYREGISAVVDVSAFETNAEKVRFCHRFGERLYSLHKEEAKLRHVFIEEAHELLPQDVGGGEAAMVGVWNTIWKQGSNFGIGGSLISQRPQDLNKKALDLSGLVFAFNTTGTRAVKAMRDWIGAEEAKGLQELQPGECVAWSPSWLKIVETVRIEARRTLHVRFDPLVALANPDAKPPRDLTPLAVAKIVETFAQVRTEDPDTVIVHRRVGLRYEDADALEEARAEIARMNAENERLAARNLEMAGALRLVRNKGIDLLDALGQAMAILHEDGTGSPHPTVRVSTRSTHLVEKPREIRREEPRTPSPTEAITSLMQEILDAVFAFDAMGTHDPFESWVGAYLGKSHRSGYWRGAMKRLVDEELLEKYNSDGGVALVLTQAGETRAKPAEPKSLDEIHALWVRKADGIAGEILKEILDYQKRTGERCDVPVPHLGAALNKSATSGYFRGGVKRLKDMGLITSKKDFVRPTELLYPEGDRMRVFMPVRLFKGGSSVPERSVWTVERADTAAPILLQREMHGATQNWILDVEIRDEDAGYVVLTPLIVHEAQRVDPGDWGFSKLESPVDDFLWCGACSGSTELAWEYDEAGGPGRWITTAEAASECCKAGIFLDPQLIVAWEPDPNDWGAFDGGAD